MRLQHPLRVVFGLGLAGLVGSCGSPASSTGFAAAGGIGGDDGASTAAAASSSTSSTSTSSSSSASSAESTTSTSAEVSTTASETTTMQPDFGATGCAGKIDFLFVLMVTDANGTWGAGLCVDCEGTCESGPPEYPCLWWSELEECDNVEGAGVTFPVGWGASNKRCEVAGGHRYMLASDPTPEETFLCLASVGYSAGSNAPVEVMLKALQRVRGSGAPGMRAVKTRARFQPEHRGCPCTVRPRGRRKRRTSPAADIGDRKGQGRDQDRGSWT